MTEWLLTLHANFILLWCFLTIGRTVASYKQGSRKVGRIIPDKPKPHGWLSPQSQRPKKHFYETDRWTGLHLGTQKNRHKERHRDSSTDIQICKNMFVFKSIFLETDSFLEPWGPGADQFTPRVVTDHPRPRHFLTALWNARTDFEIQCPFGWQKKYIFTKTNFILVFYRCWFFFKRFV